MERAAADRWISASLHEPPKDRAIDLWVHRQLDVLVSTGSRYADAEWDRERSVWTFNDRGCMNPIRGTVTHWMPIARAPRPIL